MVANLLGEAGKLHGSTAEKQVAYWYARNVEPDLRKVRH
jgi:hypothetical protein